MQVLERYLRKASSTKEPPALPSSPLPPPPMSAPAAVSGSASGGLLLSGGSQAAYAALKAAHNLPHSFNAPSQPPQSQQHHFQPHRFSPQPPQQFFSGGASAVGGGGGGSGRKGEALLTSPLYNSPPPLPLGGPSILQSGTPELMSNYPQTSSSAMSRHYPHGLLETPHHEHTVSPSSGVRLYREYRSRTKLIAASFLVFSSLFSAIFCFCRSLPLSDFILRHEWRLAGVVGATQLLSGRQPGGRLGRGAKSALSRLWRPTDTGTVCWT